MITRKDVDQLEWIAGKDNVLTTVEELTAYSYDATAVWSHMPEAVVFPTDAEQIAGILEYANEHGIPVTPRGGGTNVSGGSIPIKGGIVLCTTKMNKILDINKNNLKQLKRIYPTVDIGDAEKDEKIKMLDSKLNLALRKLDENDKKNKIRTLNILREID